MLALGFSIDKKFQTEPVGFSAGEANLRSGDILFVRGVGLLSRAVLEVDAASRFSHVGLVVRLGSVTSVIHAAPGGSLGREAEIRIEPISVVLSRVRAAAVYRLREDDEALGERAAVIARSYLREHRLFDADFRLDTAKALYCTELVWRAYLEAGFDLFDGKTDEITFPLIGRRSCLLPSRFLTSPHLQLIHRFHSKGR